MFVESRFRRCEILRSTNTDTSIGRQRVVAPASRIPNVQLIDDNRIFQTKHLSGGETWRETAYASVVSRRSFISFLFLCFLFSLVPFDTVLQDW